MTKRFYVKGAEQTLGAQIDWVANTIKAHLMLSTYTPNYSTHDFRDDIAAYIASSFTLTGKAITGGVFDANDITFPSVTAGQVCNAVVFSKEGGTDATSPLLLYIDYNDITNFRVTTAGGDVAVSLPNTAYKVFSLVP